MGIESTRPSEARITPEARRLLKEQQQAQVIISVQPTHTPDFTGITTREGKRAVGLEAGRRNLEELTQTLEAVQEVDQTIVFEPAYLNSTVHLQAPSGLIQYLATREDVVEIDAPHPLTPDAK